jgi:hypothetical protein
MSEFIQPFEVVNLVEMEVEVEEENLIDALLGGNVPPLFSQLADQLLERFEGEPETKVFSRPVYENYGKFDILWDSRVIEHAKAICYFSMDPTLSGLEQRYKDGEKLRSPIFDFSGSKSIFDSPKLEQDEEVTKTVSDLLEPQRNDHITKTKGIRKISELFRGKRKQAYEQIALDLYGALVNRKEGLSAVLATRLYVLGTYGKITISEIGELPAICERFHFVDREYLTSPIGFLWIILIMAVEKLQLDSHSFLAVWKCNKDDEKKMQILFFRSIVVICRISRLDEEPICCPEKLAITLRENLGVDVKETKLVKFQRAFYKKIAKGKTGEKKRKVEKPVSEKRKTEEPAPEDKKRKAEEPAPEPQPKKQKEVLPAMPEMIRALAAIRPAVQEIPLAMTKPASITENPIVSMKSGTPLDYLSLEMGKIYRGPYQNVKRVQNVCELLEILELEPDVRIYKPEGYAKENMTFLQYPVLATKPQSEWEPFTSDEGVKYYFRETLGIENYGKYMTDHPADLEKNFVSIYMTFLWFYVLHIGDRDLENIMYVDGKLWFIKTDTQKVDPFADLIKQKTRTFSACDFMFSKKLTGEQSTLWNNEYKKHKFEIKEKLEEIECTLGFRGVTDLVPFYPPVEDPNNPLHELNRLEEWDSPLYKVAEKLGFKKTYFYEPYKKACEKWMKQ